MTPREHLRAILAYEEFDRLPVIHWEGWKETYVRWHGEGMPEGVDDHAYFGSVPFWKYLANPVFPEYLRLFPAFEIEVLSEDEDFKVIFSDQGVIEKHSKKGSSIYYSVDHTFKTAKDWPEYKKRLQPDMARLPADWAERMGDAGKSGQLVCLPVGSFMGWLRDWMGVENMTYLLYDDPDCYGDIVNTIADLSCWFIDTVVPQMTVQPDVAFIWEDICGSTGPFVSPAAFRKYIAPAYTRIRNAIERNGIPYLAMDSDGKVDALIRPVFESGVNILFPIEVGTWQETPERIRGEFGRELRMVGGYNKLVLEKGRAEIDAELEKHLSLAFEGGYLMMPDHVITPDTPLENYRYYLERVREARRGRIGR